MPFTESRPGADLPAMAATTPPRAATEAVGTMADRARPTAHRVCMLRCGQAASATLANGSPVDAGECADRRRISADLLRQGKSPGAHLVDRDFKASRVLCRR
jgi:hypothetical protein